ncbi:MAG: cobalt/nickel transport protein [Clostridiales bacterium]|jgi:hypothetical protein|nr:cobalt/nickel transport protein [Clostridiales bacterium]MDK2992363.1 cobalt/nickel transport protein [Clostridiales bacterium]
MKIQWKKAWPWLLVIGLLLLSPFASTFPDGLERVAHDLGFIAAEQEGMASPMPDYTVPFLGEGGISTVVAGAIGAILLVIIFLAVDRLIKAHR